MSFEDLKKLIDQQTKTLLENRAQERLDDIKKISELVVTQVKEDIEPMKKKQAEFEALTTKRYDDMAAAIENLQKTVAAPNSPTTYHRSDPPAPSRPSPAGQLSETASRPPYTPLPPYKVDHDHTVKDIIEKAERTVGFQPLFKEDVDDICRLHNTTDTELAMKLLVVEYLNMEMKNFTTGIENIVRVFPPAKPNWNTLYAEFDTRATTRTVFSFTRFMRNKDQRITNYIPHMFYNQFEHLSSIAFKYRVAPHNHKTRIHFGKPDMFLQVKPPGSNSWNVVHVPDLPPVALHDKPAHLDVSPSPAPGRHRSALSKRAASSSPEVPVPRASKSSKTTGSSRSPQDQDNHGERVPENDDIEENNVSGLELEVTKSFL